MRFVLQPMLRLYVAPSSISENYGFKTNSTLERMLSVIMRSCRDLNIGDKH